MTAAAVTAAEVRRERAGRGRESPETKKALVEIG